MPAVAKRKPRKAVRGKARATPAKALRSAAMISAPKASSNYSYENPGPVGRIGRLAGGALGGYLGGPVGATLGQGIGGLAHYVGKMFGSGDYVVANPRPLVKNTIVNSSQVPVFSSNKEMIRIRHKECLGDIFTSSVANTFNIQSFQLNPGLPATFPWLSQVVGSNFQQYRFNGLAFHFRSMSADALNSTNTALGSVVMATEYDSLDEEFASKIEMENTDFGVSSKPSCDMMHGIECARNQTTISELYVRNEAAPSGGDLRLYDLGRFSIATTGFQGTSVNIGELWVTYDISLLKPIMAVPADTALVSVFTLNSVTNSVTMGASQTAVHDEIGLTFSSVKVQFPYNIQIGAIYHIQYKVTGSSVTVVLPTITTGNGMTDWTNYGFQFPANSTANTVYALSYYVKYNGGATPAALPYFQIGGDGTLPSSISAALVSVEQVSGSLPDT